MTKHKATTLNRVWNLAALPWSNNVESMWCHIWHCCLLGLSGLDIFFNIKSDITNGCQLKWIRYAGNCWEDGELLPCRTWTSLSGWDIRWVSRADVKFNPAACQHWLALTDKRALQSAATNVQGACAIVFNKVKLSCCRGGVTVPNKASSPQNLKKMRLFGVSLEWVEVSAFIQV